MQCTRIVSGLNLFLPNNTYLLIYVVPFKVVSLRLCTPCPAIVPPFSALFETESFGKREKSHHQVSWVGRVWNNRHSVLARNSGTDDAQWADGEHEFDGNPMHAQTVFQNALTWHPHEIPILFTASSVSENRFLHFIHTCSCSAHLRMSMAFHSFCWGHTTFKLDWKICILPLSALQKLVATFWKFLYIFSLLENKI